MAIVGIVSHPSQQCGPSQVDMRSLAMGSRALSEAM